MCGRTEHLKILHLCTSARGKVEGSADKASPGPRVRPFERDRRVTGRPRIALLSVHLSDSPVPPGQTAMSWRLSAESHPQQPRHRPQPYILACDPLICRVRQMRCQNGPQCAPRGPLRAAAHNSCVPVARSSANPRSVSLRRRTNASARMVFHEHIACKGALDSTQRGSWEVPCGMQLATTGWPRPSARSRDSKPPSPQQGGRGRRTGPTGSSNWMPRAWRGGRGRRGRTWRPGSRRY